MIEGMRQGKDKGSFRWRAAFLAAACAGIFFRAAPVAAVMPETIRAEELTFGETGYGLTVLRGEEPETFPVTYIGRLENTRPGQEMVLIRLHGKRLEKSGIVAGMSGSPIFFRSRLLGALAYGWQGAREPIAGVTPIDLMLKLIPETRRAEEEGWRAMLPFFDSGSEEEGSRHRSRGWVPVTTPLSVAGLPVNGASQTRERLERLGFLVVPGGRVPRKPSPLKPGSAIGVRLVDGDLSATAIGTVTWLDSDIVLAFGHSFLNRGFNPVPITGARIEAIMPTREISFKMGSATNDVGTLVRDAAVGISGRLGPRPKMIPVTVTLEAPWRKRRLHYLVARERTIAARLINAVWSASAEQELFTRGPASVDVEVAIVVEGRTIHLKDRGVVKQSITEVMPTLPVQILYENPFRSLHPDSIAVRVRVGTDLRHGEILRVRNLEPKVEAGGTLPIEVTLHVYEEGRRKVRIGVPIPSDLEEGKVGLAISGGRGVVPSVAEPRNLKDLLDRLANYESQDMLVVRIFRSEKDEKIVGDAVLPQLPQGLRGIQEGRTEAGERVLLRKRLDIPVAGELTTWIEVERKKE
ncbi:MAG: hypothetical protein D6679_03640 [Candidatus Hydrogenedentota bacterium]|nr:MAG: hypothetical protein D6679_03640 [Candidatus Hydrogenedentota bacterium]